MLDKIFDKYTNYNVYLIGGKVGKMSHDVDTNRLIKAILGCRELLTKPYLRFMYASRFDEAACVVYDNGERVTKLTTFSAVEDMINNKRFTKD